MHIIVRNCSTVHSTAQNSSDNLHCYFPDHFSDLGYWRGKFSICCVVRVYHE